MDIVVCLDKCFVMSTGVLMYSVCVNNPDVDIVFHLLIDENVSANDQLDLENVIAPFKGKKVKFYLVHSELLSASFPFSEYRRDITKVAYYRLYLTCFLPQTIDKVLYLDGDMIVRHSLLPLWETDLTGYAVGVACDEASGVIEYYNRLKYPPYLGYFNSGMLLINLSFWREKQVVNEFTEYLQHHSDDIRCHDQDVLNYVFRERKKEVSVKYNLQNGFLYKHPNYDYLKYEQEVLEAIKDPVIVHFIGHKPWNAYNRGSIHPFASTFFKYQNQTKWRGVRTEKRPMKLRIINFVADVLRKTGLKSQLPLCNQYIDIAPID